MFISTEHEILPCFDEYTDDICKPCIDGYVQPDYLSSEEDPALTKCFKNKNEDKCRETGKIKNQAKGEIWYEKNHHFESVIWLFAPPESRKQEKIFHIMSVNWVIILLKCIENENFKGR